LVLTTPLSAKKKPEVLVNLLTVIITVLNAQDEANYVHQRRMHESECNLFVCITLYFYYERGYFYGLCAEIHINIIIIYHRSDRVKK